MPPWPRQQVGRRHPKSMTRYIYIYPLWKYVFIKTHLDSGETEKGGWFDEADNIKEVGHLGARVVTSRED